MKKIKMMLIALTLLSIVTVSLVLWQRKSNQPLQNDYETIKAESDSVALISLNQPDSAKLRKLEALKRRIAEARYNDSLQRAAD